MTYSYRCKKCESEVDVFRVFAKRYDPLKCDKCNADMELIQIPKREDGMNKCHQWARKKIR